LTSGVVVARAVPPVEAAYHLIDVPVGTRLTIVGEVPAQKLWVAGPVGAPGMAVKVTVTSSLAVLSQVLMVWLA